MVLQHYLSHIETMEWLERKAYAMKHYTVVSSILPQDPYSISLHKAFHSNHFLGPLVQSIVSLMSSLVVKVLTVLVSIIFNSQIFLLKKCE